MAPRIAKTIETIFSLIILIIFYFIINKYFGESIHMEISKYLDKLKVDKVYSNYENLAKNISLTEKISNYENFVPVLVYHGVVTREPKTYEEITLEKFEQQMFELKKNGYQTITMNDFYQFINNKKKLPDKSFLLTFDDGRKDSYYPVDPILKALEFKASMFVITNTFFLEKPSPYYLNIEELKTMITSGRWDIQSHGRDDHGFIPIDEKGNVGRFMVNKKWLEKERRIETDKEYKNRIFSDLVNSKNDLKKYLGIDAIAYALPAGDYGYKESNYSNAEQEIQKVIKEVYPMTFYQFNINPDWKFGYCRENYAQDENVKTDNLVADKKWLIDKQRIETNKEYRNRIFSDLVNSKAALKEYLEIKTTSYQFNINPNWQFGYFNKNYKQNEARQYFFKRIKVFGYFDANRLLGILDASHEKNIPYKDNFSNQDNWIVGWGESSFDNHTLTLKNSNGDSSNAAIFIDGALFWKNYLFKAKLTLVSGNHYSLLARVKNGKDFVACTFGNKKIRAFTMENNMSNPLGEKEVLNFDATKKNNIGIEVRNNTLNCLVDNKVVLSNNINPAHKNGGIGFMVYSENKDVPATLSIEESISISN